MTSTRMITTEMVTVAAAATMTRGMTKAMAAVVAPKRIRKRSVTSQ